MDYRVEFSKPWRYRHRTRGAQELKPGVYDVPRELSHEMAQHAIDQGMAVWRPASGVALLIEASKPYRLEEESAEGQKPKRRRGRPRKGPAPENKMLDEPPEDKTEIC